MLKILNSFALLVFISYSIYSQQGWVVQNSGTTQTINSIYFLNYNLGFAACNGGLLIKTGNGGINWITLYTFGSDVKRLKFFNHLSGIVLCNQGIYKTTDGGTNWYQAYTSNGVLDFSYANDFNLMASYSDGRIMKSTDGGMGWSLIYPLQGPSPAVCGVGRDTGYAAVSYLSGGTSYHTIYITTNGGSQWNYFRQITTSAGSGRTGDLLFVNKDTCYFSVRIGNINYIDGYSNSTWKYRQVSNFQNSLFFSNGKTGWSAGENGTIFETTNAGNNWLVNNTPVTVNLNSIQFVNELTGWAAGEGGVILKTTTGGITFIQSISHIVPENFSLSQNYPNPFNPTTNFEFRIADFGLVRLTVFDAIGREIKVLVNQQLQPGTYEVSWDASAHPSGVYYYRLESGSFTQTKKMVLIR